MAVQLFNTLSGKKEPLEPQHPPQLSLYVCGVTPYDYSHVGHARVYVAFDVVARHLRRRGYALKYVRNFTDVDDKIIKRAHEQGVESTALANRFIDAFGEDMAALGVGPVDEEPRVTTHIPEIVALVKGLVERGHAYVVDGTPGNQDVYYAVGTFSPYLRLSGRTLEEMQAGARVDVDERKKDPLDFALWKSAKPGEPSWDSPWGKGRPGWHIECSAMCNKHLGATVDIHAGGRDLIFPHHENEIAQSQAFTGQPLARYWMHNGFVNVDNEKMSKSLGNFFTIRDVLKKVQPETLRYFLLSTHYRSPINFSDVVLEESERRVESLYETRRRVVELLAGADEPGPGYAELCARSKALTSLGKGVDAAFDEAMDDDFNTARALGVLADALRLTNNLCDGKEAELLGLKLSPKSRVRVVRGLWEALTAEQGVLRTLGLLREDPDVFLGRLRDQRCAALGLDAAWVEERLVARSQAKANKDYALSDAIRAELAARRVVVKDVPGGGWRWSVSDGAQPGG
jgi:cysteinyl-tRNA synthetase